MNVSAYSIKNPLFAILFFILLMAGGIFGFSKMQVQQFPDVEFPVVVATITLPGAAPSQLENDIAKKVENKLVGLEGVKTLYTTLQTGATTVTIEFSLDTDIQDALDEVRSAINEIKGDLPASANDPIISKISMSSEPILTYTIASTEMNESDLSWYVNNDLDKRLSGIKGIGEVSRIGGISRIIRVETDSSRLNALQMPISDLSRQIAATQTDASGGAAKVGGNTQLIRIVGAVKDADELADLDIAVPTGGAERLSSIANVIDGNAERSSTAQLDGETVVAFNIKATRDADNVELAKEIKNSLDELQEENSSLTITKAFDVVTPTEENYKNSMNMLVEGGILAVVVVFLFLLNWRATIVAATALPLSVIPTFMAMWLFDFSLNMISLLALSLVIGVLVDDAIVEVENIVRHLRMGKTPMEAAMEAADEIGLAVIATTFTLIAVFLPTAFMDGIVGQFFKQFGWTASIAIFMSLLVARLITPMMAAYIMKPEKSRVEKDGWLMKSYLSLVSKSIQWRWITLTIMVLLFIGSMSLVKGLPSTFIPANNINQTRVGIELTPDSTLADTIRITELARNSIKDINGVDSIMAAIGQPQSQMNEGSTSISSVNTASLDIVLKPRDDRPNKSDIENEINKALEQVPAARFNVGLSSGGGSGYEFQIRSDDQDLLENTAQKIMGDIRQLDMVSAVTSNRSLPKPELTITPDKLAMADRGITIHQLASTLRIATIGDFEQNLSKLNLNTRQIPIVVRLSDTARADVNEISNLYIKSGVTVGDVAKLSFSSGPSIVRRHNRQRATKVTVKSIDGDLGPVRLAVQELSSIKNIPDGVTFIEIGEAADQSELFIGFAIAIVIGIFCIFAVLILLFNRILQPFTILMALPLSIGGAFIGLLLTKSSLSLPSLIGFIMLMGIATKNSILLVDYAILAQEKQGLKRYDALISACQKRARPIIMTSIAMGAGMLPILFGWGGADQSFRQPMAAAVIGGLVTSTVLSLLVIPVMYTVMDDLSKLFMSLFGMKKS